MKCKVIIQKEITHTHKLEPNENVGVNQLLPLLSLLTLDPPRHFADIGPCFFNNVF